MRLVDSVGSPGRAADLAMVRTGAPKRWRRRLLWLTMLPAFLFAAFLILDALYPLPLPDDEGARVILAEDGTPLWRFADSNGVWRYPVTVADVSPLYIEALLTYEDRWFHRHPGVNPLALMRAAWQNIHAGRIISGGSTISMQVARLIEPHPRTIPGKIRQIWRTLQLEWHFSKTDILTMYLNRAPYGGTLEGIAAATWSYLDKPPSQLTPAEAALLAVLPQSPTRLRPDRHPKAAREARDKVLKRLETFGVWPTELVREALEEAIVLTPRQPPQLAPLLARRMSATRGAPKIRTTIDASLQRYLEDTLHHWQTHLPDHVSAAVLVVEHDSMAVRAYLGSIDLGNDRRSGHVDMVRAVRSPGSTLKPFLYGMALDDGLIHSESLLQDVPRRFGDYRPGNFSSDFSGPVAASDALAASLNLPAVQLLEAFGPKRFTALLRSAGLQLHLPDSTPPNLAVILGGAGTRLEELVAGYSVFARNGMLATPRLTPDSPLLERRLMSPGAAWIVRQILSGRLKPDTVSESVPGQDGTIALKTGTSYGMRDAWAIGVGPRHLIGVWIGRPDGTPVAGQAGKASATPLLLQIHSILTNRDRQRNLPPLFDTRPDSVSVSDICWPTGQFLSTGDPNCRQRRRAWVLDGTLPPTLLPTEYTLDKGLFQTIWIDRAGARVRPECEDAQAVRIALWPAPLAPWLPPSEQRAQRLPRISRQCPPDSEPVNAPLSIAGVRSGENLRLPQAGQRTLELSVLALGGAGPRWWFLNGRPLPGTTGHEPLAVTLDKKGPYQLSVLDESGLTASVRFHLIE